SSRRSRSPPVSSPSTSPRHRRRVLPPSAGESACSASPARQGRWAAGLRDQSRNAPEGEQLGGVGFVARVHAVREGFDAGLRADLQAPSCFPQDVLQVLNSVWSCCLQALEHLASADEGAMPAPSSSTVNPMTPVVSLFIAVSSRLSLVTVDAAT